MSSRTPDLGPVAHIAYVVDDVAATMTALHPLGARWSTIRRPLARLGLPMGDVVEVEIDYVTTSGGEPRLKLLSTAPGTIFTRERGGPVHHLSYWVADLEPATSQLSAGGWRVEATGLDESGVPAYRYLRSPDGRRIELGLESGIDAFDAWADRAA